MKKRLPDWLIVAALVVACRGKKERLQREALLALVELAHRLPDELKGDALAAARAINDERARCGALATLAPLLPDELKGDALAAARAINDEGERARLLSALAPHLPEPAKTEAMVEAFRCAKLIKDEYKSYNIILGLLPELPLEIQSEFLDAVRSQALGSFAPDIFDALALTLPDKLHPDEILVALTKRPLHRGGYNGPDQQAILDELRAAERFLNIETDRFTDLVLHRGFYYRGDAVEPARVLAATEALEPHSEYTLEVAIRRVLRVVESAGPETPVRNPRKGQEDITVFAVVECRQPNAPDFKDAMLDLTWPFESDSTLAFFRFETGPALPPEPLKIEVRLYAEAGLQLLDLLELTWASRQWTKVRPDTGPAAIAAPPSGPVQDAVTFHITGATDGFGIKAVLKRNGKVHLEVPFGRAIQALDLENLLLQVRNYWTRLVIGKMSSRRHLSERGYAQAFEDLVKLGGTAWQKLFGDRPGVLQGTPEAVGELMRNAPLPPDSPIRITFAGDAETFVFPWTILCPPLRRKEAPDPRAIWGLRYMIELTRKNDPGPYDRERDERVRIATTIDPGFAGPVDHSATLARIAARGLGAEFLDGNSEDMVLDRLEAVPPADIYYYFCHGISPGRGGFLNPDVVAEMEKTLATLPPAEKKPWETLLLRLKSDPVEASMFTGAAEITEYELRKAEFFHGRRPIVFLNMCHSADLLPLMRKGLTHVFIDRQAAAVLGTECPVTSIFADMFAEQVLTDLLNGQTIGEAVLAARRHFHAKRNPLGLLYTLYGHGDARVTDPPLT